MTYIASSYARFVITELDELWSPTIRESTKQVAERARKVLNIIFQKDIDAQCKTNSFNFKKIHARLFLGQLCLSQLMKDLYMDC